MNVIDATAFHDAWVDSGLRCEGNHMDGAALCQNVTALLARLAPPIDPLTAALEVVGPEPPAGDLDESAYEAGVWDEWFRICEGITALAKAQS
jgi:hypothetical protein